MLASKSRLAPDYGKTASLVEIGQIISGKYKLLRLLGDGGMGSVYEASHEMLGTHVAIKVLHAELVRRSGLMERFLQEARVSAQIRSPHVVQVTDVDRTSEGVAYLVMELLQGEPLSNVVRREGKLVVATACEYTLQILSALEAAHALGVIHRDLKPDNVFLTFAGGKPVIKLIDFGIAKLKRTEEGAQAKNLTVAGMLMGTPEYMAPEQAYAADKVDVRADLYSVGAMLYEMLSGRTPVSGEDPRVVVLKVERGEVTPLVHAAPNVPPEVAGFVHRAMAPRPDVRFANATEMRLALAAVLAGKRAMTAPLAAGGAGSAAAAFATTADARDMRDMREPAAAPPEIGTGTVMGAPAAAALAAVSPASPGVGTSTVRAAPIDPSVTRAPSPMAPSPAMPPAPMASSFPAPVEPSRLPPRGRGNGLVIGLAAIAALLGAGAVVAYVMSTEGGAAPPDPLAPLATATAPATSTPATTAPTAPTTVAPLAPGPGGAVAPVPGAASSAPHHPQAGHDAGAAPPATTAAPPATIPPFSFPSGMPPFVLPSSLPTMPSGFPIPSGFTLPPWPPPQQPPP
jgi:serine/threonine-protein kinase